MSSITANTFGFFLSGAVGRSASLVDVCDAREYLA